ncbi:hypothetical protein [Pseudomonas sp. RT6P73]
MRKFIGMAFLVFGAMTGNAYAAAGTEVCPKVSEIKSSRFTTSDPKMIPPFNQGYEYTSAANGKKWKGFAMGTNDDFLSDEYNLKAESYDGSTCSYGGTTIVENGETSRPYLKLHAS